jgi:hypothetical protein
MSDDLTKKGYQDRSRINMNETHEVTYWTDKYNISKEQLQSAVETAGTDEVEEIERILDKQ